MGLHGTVIPFDATQEEWSEYAERLEHYFTANDITSEAKRRAILLNAVGPTMYRLIKMLVSPYKVTDLTFEEIIAKAKVHFNPKPSPIVKRYEFNTRRQEERESVATFVAELRKVAQFCEYGDVLSDMLHDCVFCGVSNKAVQRRLLLEPALTFEKALQMALAAEAAEKDSKRLRDVTDRELPAQIQKVNRDTSQTTTRGDHPRQNQSPQFRGGRQECYKCGGKHHPSRCPFHEYECHFCKKKGHLAKVCRKKLASKPEQPDSKSEKANVVVGGDKQEDSKYPLFHVTSGSSKPLQITVKVNGNQLMMEIDTGASVSIIREQTLKLVQKGLNPVELQKSSVQLQTYTGEAIGVLGSITVPVEHNGQNTMLPLIVTAGNGPTLQGLVESLEA